MKNFTHSKASCLGSNQNTLILIGAKDPETVGIEQILNTVGYNFAYATVDGTLCNPTNAYSANNDLSSFDNVIFIECEHVDFSGNSIFIDHHRSHDYGYSFDYNDFLEAASIGQLFKLIVLSDPVASFDLSLSITFDILPSQDFYFHNDQWLLNFSDYAIIIPNHITTIAAIDHCLADAYKNLCLGVNRNDIHREQMTAISIKYSASNELISTLSDFFISCLEKENDIIDLTSIDLGIGYSLEYILLREISLFNNKAIAVKTKNEKYGQDKLMLLGLSDSQVSNFLNDSSFSEYKVSNAFGVPTRGYAGGMIDN